MHMASQRDISIRWVVAYATRLPFRAIFVRVIEWSPLESYRPSTRQSGLQMVV